MTDRRRTKRSLEAHWLWVPALIFLCLSLATTVGAEDSGVVTTRGSWQFTTGLLIGGGVDDTKIKAASSFDCEFRDSPLCSDENFEYGFVQFDARLFTPIQADILGTPRFFVRGGIMGKFGKSVGVREEDPDADVTFQSAKVEQDGIVWDVGLGVAFPLTVGSRKVQIETSVSYGQESVTGKTEIVDTDEIGHEKRKSSLQFQFLKPMLEISSPWVQLKDVRIDLFVGAYAQITLSNQKSRQERRYEGMLEYEKDLGFGGFVGTRLTFGDDGAEL